MTAAYNLWAISGMIYALAGAAMFLNSTYAIPAPFELQNKATREADLVKSTARWLDARVGAALLVVGFFLQATGAAGTSLLNVPAVFVLLGLAAFAGYYALSKDLIAERLVSGREVQQQSATPKEAPKEPPAQQIVPAAPIAAEIVTVYEVEVKDSAA